jgi:hypothetical protein
MDLTGIATVALALVTLVVAVATLVTARQTKDLADYTKNLGVQAERQVREMETSRKLEWAPYLSFEQGGDNISGELTHYAAIVLNIGRGPAINCLLARYLTSRMWCVSGNFEVGGGQRTTDKVVAMSQTDPVPAFLSQMGAGRTVMFCLDQFDSSHMFDPSRRAHSWPTDGVQPEWAKWYQARLDTR